MSILKQVFSIALVVSLFVPTFVNAGEVEGVPQSRAQYTSVNDSYPKLRIIDVDSSDFSGEYRDALTDDPIEGVNRKIFGFNSVVDEFILEPVAKGYRFAMPRWGRNRVSDFFNNMGEPRNFVNSILQTDIEGTFRSFWRFVINSTFGIGGLHDVAAGFGLEDKDKGFSQTLAFYGVGSGEYIVLPFFGPSTYRDGVSLIFDAASDPSSYPSSNTTTIALSVADVVSARERLLDIVDDIKQQSFDPYSAFKSTYLQRRRVEVIETIE